MSFSRHVHTNELTVNLFFWFMSWRSGNLWGHLGSGRTNLATAHASFSPQHAYKLTDKTHCTSIPPSLSPARRRLHGLLHAEPGGQDALLPWPHLPELAARVQAPAGAHGASGGGAAPQRRHPGVVPAHLGTLLRQVKWVQQGGPFTQVPPCVGLGMSHTQLCVSIIYLWGTLQYTCNSVCKPGVNLFFLHSK